MSFGWREWLKIKTRKQLGISEKDDQTLRDNIPFFCRISDELMREQIGEDGSIQKEFEELPEEQKLDFTREVIKKGLEKLKKKKKPNQEQESDENSDKQGKSMLQQKQMEKQKNVAS